MLDGLDDSHMELATSLLKQRSVRDVVREDMLEDILALGKETRFVQQVGADEVRKASVHLRLRSLGKFPEQREWHVGPDDRSGLEHTLLGCREPIDAGG